MKKICIVLSCLIIGGNVQLHSSDLQVLLNFKDGSHQRNHSYLDSKYYTEQSQNASYGALGTAACFFGGLLHACRNVPVNDHLYAGGCAVGAGVATIALLAKTELVQKCTRPIVQQANRLLFRNFPESAYLQKIKTRTLLDGFDAIKRLEHLSAEEVEQLEQNYMQWQQEELKKIYPDPAEYNKRQRIAALHDPVFNLLACAKNAEGKLEIPAQIKQQKQHEDLVLQLMGKPDAAAVTKKCDNTLTEGPEGLSTLHGYTQTVFILKKDVQICLNCILTPAAAIAGYVAAHNKFDFIPHRGLRMGACVASAIASGIASLKLTNILYPVATKLPGIRSLFNTRGTQQARANASQCLQGIAPEYLHGVKAINMFCQTYGYIPHDEDYRDMRKAAQYKEEARLALELIEGVEQARKNVTGSSAAHQ